MPRNHAQLPMAHTRTKVQASQGGQRAQLLRRPLKPAANEGEQAPGQGGRVADVAGVEREEWSVRKRNGAWRSGPAVGCRPSPPPSCSRNLHAATVQRPLPGRSMQALSCCTSFPVQGRAEGRSH